MGHALLHALLDSLKVLPFLILLYIAIEVIEEKVSTSKQFTKYTNGKYATVVGAGLGLIPQCGFSVVASDLYAKRYIKMGTVLAIFIATSDEAVPIILSNPFDEIIAPEPLSNLTLFQLIFFTLGET